MEHFVEKVLHFFYVCTKQEQTILTTTGGLYMRDRKLLWLLCNIISLKCGSVQKKDHAFYRICECTVLTICLIILLTWQLLYCCLSSVLPEAFSNISDEVIGGLFRMDALVMLQLCVIWDFFFYAYPIRWGWSPRGIWSLIWRPWRWGCGGRGLLPGSSSSWWPENRWRAALSPCSQSDNKTLTL